MPTERGMTCRVNVRDHRRRVRRHHARRGGFGCSTLAISRRWHAMIWRRMRAMFPIRPLGHFLRQLSTYSRTAPITWLDDQRVCACRYPRAAEFEALVAHDVSLLVNLHVRPHAFATLERYALTEFISLSISAADGRADSNTGITAIAKTVTTGR